MVEAVRRSMHPKLIPHDPLREGWHWVRTPWGKCVVRYWYPEGGTWSDGLGSAHSDKGWRYEEPCVSPDERKAAPDA